MLFGSIARAKIFFKKLSKKLLTNPKKCVIIFPERKRRNKKMYANSKDSINFNELCKLAASLHARGKKVEVWSLCGGA